jgi:hypothetical protein
VLVARARLVPRLSLRSVSGPPGPSAAAQTGGTDLQGFDCMSTSVTKPPEILNKIVDLVLAHKPKAAKAKVAKKREKVTKKKLTS